MKKMMILASAIMMAAAGNAKENVETKPFEGVNISVPAHIRFINGEDYRMGVRGIDRTAEQNILWSVEDGVLTIRPRYAVSDTDTPDVLITIIAPTLPTLTVAGNLNVKERNTSKEVASLP